jgi:hypothetical protein
MMSCTAEGCRPQVTEGQIRHRECRQQYQKLMKVTVDCACHYRPPDNVRYGQSRRTSHKMKYAVPPLHVWEQRSQYVEKWSEGQPSAAGRRRIFTPRIISFIHFSLRYNPS